MICSGIVLFFNNTKGWGLIQDKDGKVFFVHWKDITCPSFNKDNIIKFRTLKPGQAVTFKPSLVKIKTYAQALEVWISDKKYTTNPSQIFN